MADAKDYLGEKLRLVERAREDAYFHKLDQELINTMRQKAASDTEEEQKLQKLFSPILVPVDFSAYATKALVYAGGVAARFGASLIVLHVIGREFETQAVSQHLEQTQTAAAPFADVPSETLENVVVDLRQKAYKALEDFLPPELARYDIELRVVVGNPFERILEMATQEPAGLVVMGTHGRTGLARTFMGSVAERIVRLAPCPVLTVKAGTAEEEDWQQAFYETLKMT